MPRPKTKGELILASQTNFEKLKTFVNSLSESERNKTFPEGTLNRNIRDVLAHLHHWHLLFLEWYNIGMAGKKPDMPAKDYTWKTLPALNKIINQKYSEVSLEEVNQMLNGSFSNIQKIMEQHSNEELFEKKRYHWTGSTSLGAYLISATSSHYDWAYKLIKKSLK